MKLSIPSIKLPTLPKPKITGSFSFGPPPTVPRISWNALGGIFTKPTLFNTANAGMQGVGEAGSEAILPLNAKTFGGLASGIVKELGGALNQQSQQQDVETHYNFTFNVDKMTGGEADVSKFTKHITDNLKRNKGGR